MSWAGNHTLSKIKLVVFDWNGTVLNDESVAVMAFSRILHKIDHPEKHRALELHRQHFQIPVKNMYKSLGFEDHGETIVAESVWETVYEKEVNTAELQPGISEAIEKCKKLGIQTGILSNYTVPSIINQMRKRNIKFDYVLANNSNSEAYNTGKLHRMEKFIEEHRFKPDEIMIIGDSEEEYKIAHKIGAKGYFITNGWVPEGRIEFVPKSNRIHSSEISDLIVTLA